jgi:ring-1,2-phenylacetyl-CoA epoxidase subunit PaaD
VRTSPPSAAPRSRPVELVETSRAWAIAAAVLDPEVPVLTIEDLGILRSVEVSDESPAVTVTITPTYSGCPAMEAIRDDIVAAFTDGGFDDVHVRFVLSPAWTTDWMSDEGRRKLEEYGVAPPGRTDRPVSLSLSVRCPQCGSPDTRELSRFGSTACKSLWVCSSCREPFDHFKTI